MGASSASEVEQPGPSPAESLPFLQPGAQPGSLGRLGHYEVLELLGKGGFGIVLKAFDDKLQRLVAIKVLAPHLAPESPPPAAGSSARPAPPPPSTTSMSSASTK